ncbi:hypothetical protein C5167_034750 [Papaver somniferum]|uniref:Uncharacterized protein n=1 Tax=Papaver somniferum TaxID=3469 RepID=A0A4Y7KGW4_PAPSO|nr:hypothetical protein C5167_034750 [Papaver somniferum]
MYNFPVLSQPLELGADIVMHLATKSMYGHVDVMSRFIAVKGERYAAFKISFWPHVIDIFTLSNQKMWFCLVNCRIHIFN